MKVNGGVQAEVGGSATRVGGRVGAGHEAGWASGLPWVRHACSEVMAALGRDGGQGVQDSWGLASPPRPMGDVRRPRPQASGRGALAPPAADPSASSVTMATEEGRGRICIFAAGGIWPVSSVCSLPLDDQAGH